MKTKDNFVDSALFLLPPDNWGEVVGVMKPGAHLLLFNNVKNHHLGAISVEDHGLEIRDTLAYVFTDGENDAAMKLVTLTRKPIEGTVAANVLKWGCGGLNIDICRINSKARRMCGKTEKSGQSSFILGSREETYTEEGRWPANIAHDNSSAIQSLFPESKTQRIEKPCPNPEITGHKWGTLQGNRGPRGYDGDGSAARFFYAAPTLNNLIAYLIKLVTPPGGTVLILQKDFDLIEKAAEAEGFTLVRQND